MERHAQQVTVEAHVPTPWRCVLCAQGDVHKKKEVVQDVTLHDLDAANARPQVRCLSPQVGCFDSYFVYSGSSWLQHHWHHTAGACA